MSTVPGQRAGMAIVRIERDQSNRGRILIRISTVDEVTTPAPLAAGTPFADTDAACAHLCRWLDRWICEP